MWEYSVCLVSRYSRGALLFSSSLLYDGLHIDVVNGSRREREREGKNWASGVVGLSVVIGKRQHCEHAKWRKTRQLGW